MSNEIKSYTDQSIDLIAGVDLLSYEDFQFLVDSQDELEDAWGKVQIFRTETEMLCSVLEDISFPTPAAKYWQCVREQNTMFEQLVKMGFDYRRNELEIMRISAKLQAATDGLDIEALHIDLEERIFARANLARIAADRVRELRLWSKIKSQLLDGSFDAHDPNTHQPESYLERFRRQFANLQPGAGISEINNLMGQLQTTDAYVRRKQSN